jgi:hypothetical protein
VRSQNGDLLGSIFGGALGNGGEAKVVLEWRPELFESLFGIDAVCEHTTGSRSMRIWRGWDCAAMVVSMS